MLGSWSTIVIAGFIITILISSITYMYNSTKNAGITEQKIIQYKDIIKEREKNEKIAARPSATIGELLTWLREHEK
jgi:hypothetical protein